MIIKELKLTPIIEANLVVYRFINHLHTNQKIVIGKYRNQLTNTDSLMTMQVEHLLIYSKVVY